MQKKHLVAEPFCQRKHNPPLAKTPFSRIRPTEVFPNDWKMHKRRSIRLIWAAEPFAYKPQKNVIEILHLHLQGKGWLTIKP